MTKKKDPKDYKKKGRPSKITAEIVAKLEQAYKIGANDTEACLHAGIDRTTLFRYEQSNPDFSNKKAEWKRNPILKAKHTIYKNLDDPSVAKWLLERKDDEYKNKQEFSGNVNVIPTEFNILPVRSNDEH
jgi:hypothetical protein